MSRGHEAMELMEKNDPLSNLPDHVLSKIICKLDLKEAMRTSILSKRWRYIWTHYRELEFNHVNILGLKSRLEKDEWVDLDTEFVKLVDKIMEQRFEGDIRKVNSFYIEFPLGANFSSSINRWIDFVVANNVESIDLYLRSRLPLPRYSFSLPRIVSNNENRTLKHLQLTHCNIQGQITSQKFSSLISIQLHFVTISTPQLAKVLESCPLLEELTLNKCGNLNKLTINATHLKHFSLINCFKIKEIDVIHAPNLISLELDEVMINSKQLEMFIKRCPLLEELSLNSCPQLKYMRILESNNSPLKYLCMMNCWEIEELDLCANRLHTLECYLMTNWFKVMKTPELVNVFIGNAVDLKNPLTKLVQDIPSLENLNLGSYHTLNFFFADDPVPALSMRQLVLNVYLCDNDIDEILWVSNILKGFPLLETLELNFIDFSIYDNGEKMTFEIFPNGTITKVEMNGFNGNRREVNVLRYLLQNLTGLEELVIGPCIKRYRSFNCWSHEESKGKNWLRCNYEWLRTIVPLNVDLKFIKDLDSVSDLL